GGGPVTRTAGGAGTSIVGRRGAGGGGGGGGGAGKAGRGLHSERGVLRMVFSFRGRGGSPSQTCIDHLCGQPQLARITRWVDRISARGGSPRSSMRARSRAAALRPRSLSGWLTVVTAGVTIRLA